MGKEVEKTEKCSKWEMLKKMRQSNKQGWVQ